MSGHPSSLPKAANPSNASAEVWSWAGSERPGKSGSRMSLTLVKVELASLILPFQTNVRTWIDHSILFQVYRKFLVPYTGCG